MNRKRDIVWQFGITERGEMADNKLNNPVDAKLLKKGNVLVTDKDNARIILVTKDKKIIYRYGWSVGLAENQLNRPIAAGGLSNGNILITDQLNHRIIEVDGSSKLIWQYGDPYERGDGFNQLSFPSYAEEALVPLKDPNLKPPKKTDPNSLSFLWVIGGWAVFCFAVVFGLYYFTSREHRA